MRSSVLRVVVAGGGVAALEAALTLRTLAPGRLGVTLLAPRRHFVHRSLAGLQPRALRLPLDVLEARAGITHIRDAVDAVDGEGRQLRTQDGARIDYDAAVLAVGARRVAAVPGALTYRGPHDAPRLRDALGRMTRLARPRVVFALPGGAVRSQLLYELALEATCWLAEHDTAAELALVTPEPEPLRGVEPEVAVPLLAALAAHGVVLRTGELPGFVEDGRLWTAQSGGLRADLVVALPHLSGRGVTGLPSDDAEGRVEGVPGTFAIGDMTTAARSADAVAQAQRVARLVAAEAGAGPRPPRAGARGVADGRRGLLVEYLAEHAERVALPA